jgi:hypothetical protein
VDGREVSPERLQGERRRHVEGVEEVGHVGEDERSVAHRHAVGADEREPLLGLQAYGLEARRPKGLGSRHPASPVLGLAAADEDLSYLSHLGEVGLADGSSPPDDGVDPGVQGV